MGPEECDPWRVSTVRFVLAVVASVAVYDPVARLWGGSEVTVSAVLLDASGRWPVVAVAAGILCGHVWLACAREGLSVPAAFAVGLVVGAYYWPVR